MLAGTLVLLPLIAAAQTAVPALMPDRPDFTDSSDVVGHRVVQIETGVRFEQSDRESQQVSVPDLLVRVGLGSRFELRVGADGYISQSVRTPSGHIRTHGRSDVDIGAKLNVMNGSAAGLYIAVLPFLSFPTASNGLGDDGHDAGMKLAASRDFPHDFGLSGNVNLSSIGTPGGRTWRRELSLSAGKGFGAVWGGFAEIYGAIAGDACDCAVDVGVSRAIGTNSQLDVEGGRRLTGLAPSWYVGAGFAVRRLHH